MNVAVIAHTGKTLGGGLGELRQLLASAGYDDPVWYEVPKSRKAPKKAAKVRDAGVDLVFVWGGDGMVQRCVDGADWYHGRATCVLLGNVGQITGGTPAFPGARPDDGRLDVGVSTAEGALQWARTFGRMVTGQARRSPFVQTTRAARVEVRF